MHDTHNTSNAELEYAFLTTLVFDGFIIIFVILLCIRCNIQKKIYYINN